MLQVDRPEAAAERGCPPRRHEGAAQGWRVEDCGLDGVPRRVDAPSASVIRDDFARLARAQSILRPA